MAAGGRKQPTVAARGLLSALRNRFESADRGLLALNVVENFGLLGVILIGVVALSFASDVFLTTTNFSNVLYQSTIVAVVALGEMFVILVAGIDLSVGAVLALSSVLSVGLTVNQGLPPAVGIGAGLGVGLLFGLLNGIVTTKLRISPLIVTLATMSIARGAAFIYSDGKNIAPVPDVFQEVGNTSVGSFPVVIFFTLALAIVAQVMLSRTRFGRSIYAVGGNRHAAQLAGIRSDRVVIAAFAISGLMAGLGGVMISARLGAGAATSATGLELTVIAAVVIGGTSLFGGEGNVGGTVLGVLLLGLVQNAIDLLGVPPNYDLVVSGVVIVIAAGLDVYRRQVLEPRLVARPLADQTGEAADAGRGTGPTAKEVPMRE